MPKRSIILQSSRPKKAEFQVRRLHLELKHFLSLTLLLFPPESGARPHSEAAEGRWVWRTYDRPGGVYTNKYMCVCKQETMKSWPCGSWYMHGYVHP